MGCFQNHRGSSPPPAAANVLTLLCHIRKQHCLAGILVSHLIRAVEFLNLTTASNSVLSREIPVEMVGLISVLLKMQILKSNIPSHTLLIGTDKALGHVNRGKLHTLMLIDADKPFEKFELPLTNGTQETKQKVTS